MKQRLSTFTEAIDYRLLERVRVELGPGPGFGRGRREPGSRGGDPRSSYRRRLEERDRLRLAAARLAGLVRRQHQSHPVCPVLLEQAEPVDVEISRIDAGDA